MAIQKTRGFILRREDIRETSILFTIYTKDFGKIRTLIKGVRSPEHLFNSSYELFALDDIVFYERKKKDVYILSQCELVNFFPKIRKEFDRLAYAIYLVELLDAVTPLSDSNAKLYDILLKSFRLLSSKSSPKRVARVFEIKLLSALGFMPRLKNCVSCNADVKGGQARFSLTSGGLLCKNCFKRDTKATSILAGTVNFISHVEREPFERVDRIKVSSRVGKQLEILLKSFLRFHLDIRLRSLDFIKKVGI